jgi:hypothetical protein
MLMKKLALWTIKAYQKLLSPDHSFWAKSFFPHGYCKFNPTCSCYTHQAIEKYGVIKGSWLGLNRIIRCNPWNDGGDDPLP